MLCNGSQKEEQLLYSSGLDARSILVKKIYHILVGIIIN